MSEQLPKRADPDRLCDLGKRFAGQIPLVKFQRMADLLAEQDGQVGYEIEFFRDEDRRPCIRGRIRTSLRLICQRCLEPMTFLVDENISLAVVESITEMDRLPEQYESLLMEEPGVINIMDMIEDELLLALPQVPKHGQRDCSVSLPEDDSSEQFVRRDNHFAMLIGQASGHKEPNKHH